MFINILRAFLIYVSYYKNTDWVNIGRCNTVSKLCRCLSQIFNRIYNKYSQLVAIAEETYVASTTNCKLQLFTCFLKHLIRWIVNVYPYKYIVDIKILLAIYVCMIPLIEGFFVNIYTLIHSFKFKLLSLFNEFHFKLGFWSRKR